MRIRHEIDSLKQRICHLGSLVEDRFYKSIKSLDKGDIELALEVVNGDNEIDLMEVEIEEECLKVLALHQPVAIDLRYLVGILKINNDLERVGDLTVNISTRVIALLEVNAKPIFPFDFNSMCILSKNMLKSSLDAFVNLNTVLANAVIIKDIEVDKINKSMYACIEESIKIEPNNLKSFLYMMNISKYIERISDHATNIAEDVIYMTSGQIIRHKLGELLQY